jgi:hypothetical protein
VAIRPGSLSDDLRDMQAWQRQRLTRQLERHVRGVVGAREEIAAGRGKPLSRLRQMRFDRRQRVALVLFERGPHRQDRQRDLRVLVRPEPARRLAHRFQEAQRRAIGAVSEDADMPHSGQLLSGGSIASRAAWIVAA